MGVPLNREKATILMDSHSTRFHCLSLPIWLGLRTSAGGICPSLQMNLLQYVDDLLLSGLNKKEITDTTISLLNFLGHPGLRVSKTK
jgi:hypothetical protein